MFTGKSIKELKTTHYFGFMRNADKKKKDFRYYQNQLISPSGFGPLQNRQSLYTTKTLS